MQNWSRYVVIITFIWAGMILGLSFLEAPIKFQAPNVSLAIDLGIGRLVFAALNKFEIFFMLLIGLSSVAGKFSRAVKVITAALAVILAVQTFYLLPALDVRALQVIAGNAPQESFHHIVYIILEVLKLVLLIWLGVKQLKQFAINLSA